MPWQFFLAFYFVFAVANTLFSRWFAQRSKLSARLIAAVSYVCGVFPISLAIGLLGEERVFNWETSTLLLLVVNGLFIAVFGWASFASKKLVSVTTFMTLFQLYVIAVILLGWVLLGESLSLVQAIGGSLLLLGAYLAIYSIKKKGSYKSSLRGAILAGLSGLALGIVIVGEKAVLSKMNTSAYFIIGFGTQALAMLLMATPDIRTSRRLLTRKFELLGATACGVLAALGGYMYITTLTKVDNVSLVVLLTTFQVPLSVVASRYILGERDNSPLLLTACLLSFVGLVIASL